MGMVPGTGTLDIDTADSGNGPVRTFRLSASLPNDHPAGPAYLSMDLRIRAVLDSGISVQLGTAEMPVRLDVSGSNPLKVSCSWRDAI
jgi:hypothetical protein